MFSSKHGIHLFRQIFFLTVMKFFLLVSALIVLQTLLALGQGKIEMAIPGT